MMTFLAGTFLQASLARLRAEVDRNVAVELLTLINYYCHSSHLSWVWLGLAFRFLFSFSFYSESPITSALFRKFKAVRFASCGFLGTDRLRAHPILMLHNGEHAREHVGSSSEFAFFALGS